MNMVIILWQLKESRLNCSHTVDMVNRGVPSNKQLWKTKTRICPFEKKIVMIAIDIFNSVCKLKLQLTAGKTTLSKEQSLFKCECKQSIYSQLK